MKYFSVSKLCANFLNEKKTYFKLMDEALLDQNSSRDSFPERSFALNRRFR